MPPPRQARRAWLLLVAACVAGAVIWRLRPAAPGSSGAPDADIVSGCAWLAWVLAGYLAVVAAVMALQHLRPRRARRRARLRLAPRQLRHLIELVLSVGLTTTVIGSTVAAAAPSAQLSSVVTPGHSRGAPPSADGSALDWPGLTDTGLPTIAPTPAASHPAAAASHPAAARQPARPTRHHPDPGLVGGGRVVPVAPRQDAGTVVVSSGDSLWSIAARTLRPHAGAAAITRTWHRWYAANRGVVGRDPGLIYPGQHLRAPSRTATPHPTLRSTP